MPDIAFLDRSTKLYDQHVAGWKRDESRLYGGDAVLEELLKWKGEDADYFTARQGQAGYITLPKLHATTLVGHLSKGTPMPEFAQLGQVRERSKMSGAPSLAELLWYNVDGVSQDGAEFIPWFDGVNERALATGYRWVMVEMPTAETLAGIQSRRIVSPTPNGKMVVTGQDVLDGFRPYAVEYSPISVPYWQHTNGRLDFAVIRIPVIPTNLLDTTQPTREGYYLLVRQGFSGFGTPWDAGGWWKFDQDHSELPNGHGTWDQTRGQIPLFQFIGEPSPGTTERPAIARSLTMELGQIAVSLMNRISERNWNVSFSAKSINYVLGIDPESHGKVVEQHEAGSIMVGIPPVMLQDGKVGIPTMWNSSAAALDSGVFESVIKSSIEEAREIMVKQVTSLPQSSGASKEAGFSEATSPLLARLAASRQQAINTFLYFASLRFGIADPKAVVTIPREFDLQPVVDDVDAMMNTLKRSWLRSPTWEAELLLRAGDERGLLPEDIRETVKAELGQSAVAAQQTLDAQGNPIPPVPVGA